MQEARGKGRSWKKSMCFWLVSSERLCGDRVPSARPKVMRVFHTTRFQREPQEQSQGGRKSQRLREMEQSQGQGHASISFGKKHSTFRVKIWGRLELFIQDTK